MCWLQTVARLPAGRQPVNTSPPPLLLPPHEVKRHRWRERLALSPPVQTALHPPPPQQPAPRDKRNVSLTASCHATIPVVPLLLLLLLAAANLILVSSSLPPFSFSILPFFFFLRVEDLDLESKREDLTDFVWL